MKAFEYYRPKTLTEAVSLLKKLGSEAAVMNGGTDLIVRMREGISQPAYLVDIKGIDELHEIRIDGDEVSIGACVLLNDMARHPVLLERVPFLCEAARSVGSVQVRNRATCSGNLCNASPLADTATPLLCLEATLQIVGPEGRRSLPLREFFVFVRKTALREAEIVSSIRFSIPAGVQGVFQKMSRRKEVDLSTVCSTLLKIGDEYRLAIGAVAPTPIRLPETEALFHHPEPLQRENIIQSAMAEVKPISDLRASESYRRELVGVMVRRALETLCEERS